MKPVKGSYVVLTLVAVMITLYATRYYLASSPSIPGPKFFQLTNPQGRTLDPDLSPDGRLIAYASDKAGDGHTDIWVRQVGGGESIQVTHEHSDAREPAYSPDGLSLAYVTTDGLFTIDMRGNPPVRLVASAAVHAPRYSPDGHWLAYRLGDGDVYLQRIDLAKQQPVLLTHSGGDPDWSADSQMLLLTGPAWQVMPVKGGEPRVLPGHAGPARWYRNFVYYADQNGLRRVRLTPGGELDPAPSEPLTDNTGQPSRPTVAGTRVVYLRGGSIWLTNLPSGY